MKKRLRRRRSASTVATLPRSQGTNSRVTGHGTCPMVAGDFLVSPLRRLLMDPGATILPRVRPGMHVLEPGPAMGFFTLALAERGGHVGDADLSGDLAAAAVAGLALEEGRALRGCKTALLRKPAG